ncbi:hypothetical protein D3C85_939490 [compost metagenome]
MPLAVRTPLRGHGAGAIGDGLFRGRAEELDALHGEVTVVGVGIVTVVGGLDHHGIEATLLHLEVPGIVAASSVGAEALGTDQIAVTVELDHTALQLATKHLAELDIDAIGDGARIQLDDQLFGSGSSVSEVAEIDLVGEIEVRRRHAGDPQPVVSTIDIGIDQV